MKPDNLRKKQRLFEKAFQNAVKREEKGLFEGAALAYMEASKLLTNEENPEAKAGCLDKCGYCYDESGNYKLAKESYEKALDIKQTFLPAISISIADTLNDLGVVNQNLGEYKEAEIRCKQALDIREKLLGKENSHTLQTLNNLSNIYYYDGKFEQALDLYHSILEVQRKKFQNENLELALTFYNLGNTYQSFGNFEKSMEYCQKSLDIRERILGSNDRLVAESLTIMGIVCLSTKDFEMAGKFFSRALDIFDEVLGKNHPSITTPLEGLGGVYAALNDYKKAEDCYQRSLNISQHKLGDQHRSIARSLINLGGIFFKQGKFDETEGCYIKSLSILEKCLDKDHPHIGMLFNNLGELYSCKGEYSEAEEYFSKAMEIIRKSLLPDHPYSKDIENNYQDLQQKVAALERERLEKRAALHKAERLGYLGQMATLMAHNINQPIAVLRMAASGALSDVNENLFKPETELKPLLEKLLAQTERLSDMMGNFRHFARGDRTVLSAVNLNTVIEAIYQLLFVAQYQLEQIDLQKEFSASPIAHANEWALQEMLISLLSNARAAVKDKAQKQVAIRTWQQDQQVGFCIEDSGDGIAAENLPKLFTPFLSSKEEGMGLGLYFCRQIAHDLGGSIDYYPSPLGGAGFKITLPAQQE